MPLNTKILELDIPKAREEAKASHSVGCDSCGKKLGERWAQGRSVLALSLKRADATEDMSDYDKYQESHFCNEDCLREHLNARAKKNC